MKWTRSKACSNSQGCVEVSPLPPSHGESEGKVGLRDSKHPNGPVLIFSDKEWAAFIEGVKGDEFDYDVLHRG